MGEFKVGDIVCLKSDRTSFGPVVNIREEKPETIYQVWLNSTASDFYASQLQLKPEQARARNINCDEFHSHIAACYLRQPSLSTLYSLHAARINFIPYQFRPVLKFIRSDRPRLLIADSVGVGKTIEAGLMLKELQARQEVKSVLIICPRPLVTEKKWEQELKRFGENFTALTSKELKYCIRESHLDGEWPDKFNKIIVPYSLLSEELLEGVTDTEQKKNKIQQGLLDLDPPPHFDFVIIDEAHHIRNSNTNAYKCVKFFCENAEAAVFLTATPVQLGSNDLFTLLNVLRPETIIDQESFIHMTEPNQFINQAISFLRTNNVEASHNAIKALSDAANTAWGHSILLSNLDYHDVLERLKHNQLTDIDRLKLINKIESLHSLAHIISRTRRRDIGEFTQRKAKTIDISFTPEQQELHDNILAIRKEVLTRKHGATTINFMMTTLMRQVASCLYGLAPMLEEILNRNFDELLADNEFNDDYEKAFTDNSIEELRETMQELVAQAQNLPDDDPKIEALLNAVNDKQKLVNNKIIIFSSFKHTLHYILNKLKARDYRVGLIHGGVADEERIALRSRFEKNRDDPTALDIMLFSEVGCEGLDYQFCDCMINYDLPWNPMRIEQRIGRIDRNGQQSESVQIINLVTANTIDYDIYYRCLERIGIFQKEIGGNEEILGEITKEIGNIAEEFSLTATERQKKLEQLSDNKIRLINEQAMLEERESELFGLQLAKNHDENEIKNASNFWLSPLVLQKLIETYLIKLTNTKKEFFMGGTKALKSMRLDQEIRNKLLQDFKKLPRTKQNIPAYRDWEKYLKGAEPYLQITFDQAEACKNPNVTFIMPLHPFIEQAKFAIDFGQPVITSLQINRKQLTKEYRTIPLGNYEFMVFQWELKGVRHDNQLHIISSNEKMTEYLPAIMQYAGDYSGTSINNEVATAWQEINAMHHSLWVQEKERHTKYTQQIAAYRRASLERSYQARQAWINDQLKQATNKIKIMKQAELKNIQVDYERRLQEIENAIDSADILTTLLAHGVLHIREE